MTVRPTLLHKSNIKMFRWIITTRLLSLRFENASFCHLIWDLRGYHWPEDSRWSKYCLLETQQSVPIIVRYISYAYAGLLWFSRLTLKYILRTNSAVFDKKYPYSTVDFPESPSSVIKPLKKVVSQKNSLAYVYGSLSHGPEISLSRGFST